MGTSFSNSELHTKTLKLKGRCRRIGLNYIFFEKYKGENNTLSLQISKVSS